MFLLAFAPGSILLSAAAFFGLLVPLVLVHELGHFVAAKAFGIKVLEFGVGFPPRIKRLTWRRGETEYTINWLPIGGFVRLLGEEDPSDPRSLAAARPWKRLVVMFAGVAMNIVFAVFLLGVSFMVPRERALTLAQVTEVAPGSPASQARIEGEMRDGSQPLQGLQVGDLVIDVEGHEIKNTSELVYANRLNLGEMQTWTIVRAASTLTAHVYARWHPPAGEGPTGIRVGAPASCSNVDAEGNPSGCDFLYRDTETVWYWPWEAFPRGFNALIETVVLSKNELRVRFGGGGGGAAVSSGPAIQGPVGIASITGDIVEEQGWRPLIELAALLSLNLGIFNALPIPMLDGGRMMFVFVEILRRGKRVAPEREQLVHLAGFALLMAGIVIVTFFDIARLVS